MYNREFRSAPLCLILVSWGMQDADRVQEVGLEFHLDRGHLWRIKFRKQHVFFLFFSQVSFELYLKSYYWNLIVIYFLIL